MGSKGKVQVAVAKKTKLNDKSAKARVETVIDSEQESESNSQSELSNDEVDLDEASSEEESESEDEEQEEPDAFPRKKKSAQSKHDDGSATFSSALTNILSSHLKAYDRKDPIMARNKKVIKQSETDKLDLKARKAIIAEKRKLLEKSRKKDIIPVVASDADSENIREILEKERKLRKIAQKGVVKLFNAILSTQVKTEKEVNESLTGIKNRAERKELITEVSKEKFFDLVKTAGDS